MPRLMGSAVSAPIKQQAKALKGRRYMRGMLPEKYFEVVVKKEHGELLDILGFSEEEAFEIFVQVPVTRYSRLHSKTIISRLDLRRTSVSSHTIGNHIVVCIE